MTKAFGKPKQGTILSYTDNDVNRKLWLRDAPVDPPTLHEHCNNIRKNAFSSKLWQVPNLASPVESLKLLPEGGVNQVMLYNDGSDDRIYTACSSLEQAKGLEMLRVRKAEREGEHESEKYLLDIYESPYSLYGEAEVSREQMIHFTDGRNGHFLQDAVFDDVGDHTSEPQICRRYSDNGKRLVDERRLAAMEEGEFVSLAIRKHRSPDKDIIRRCLWSTEQLWTRDDRSVRMEDHLGWTLWQRVGIELCCVEANARQ